MVIVEASNLARKANAIVALYNEIMQSHKRLTNQQLQELQQGTRVTLHNGTPIAWTSSLLLQWENNKFTIDMLISPAIVGRMHETLVTKRTMFLEKALIFA